MKYTTAIIVSFALLVVLGAGCGQSAGEKIVGNSVERGIERETGRDVDVDVDRDTVDIRDEETGATFSAGEDVRFPDDFPSDVPRYEDGTLNMINQNMAANQVGYMMTTGDSQQDVIAWFKTKASAENWKLKSTMDIQGSTMVMWERADGGSTYVLSVTVSPDEEDATLQHIVVNKGAR